MKLYLAPGACSLADHIALHEAGAAFGCVKVDLKTKRTEDGRDYDEINPKGYVPALELDDGQVLTENIAILYWVADLAPELGLSGAMGRFRLLEMLAFISTELHKGFKPFFKPDASDADKADAGQAIGKRLDFLANQMRGDYLFGDQMSVADAYLFVMLAWAKNNDLPLPNPLPAFFERMRTRPAVRLALEHEGLGKLQAA
ncbi:MAG: glutathione binding-like protein [Caulobacterales bacterium]|jgi:glutathione S-transferase